MTIILFLVDTSSSMCQKAYVNGVQKSYLDIAKGSVETFLKYRQRTQDCLGDRYMLLTFEEPPSNVKAGWKENHATFINELKNLQSNGLTSMGESLKNAFDLLNLNRMQSGIDTYGQGRCPFYLEPSVIIVITDGGRYSFRSGVHQEIILPLNTQIPGTKFTKEPFRWDQRLFSLVLRMSGNRVDERVEGKVPHDDSPIERMCEVTGGRSYRVRSHYVLNQCIESLVQKVQPGVVLNFEPMIPFKEGGLPNEALQDIAFQPTKKMIYVQKHISQKTFPIGYWPLPEPYWPDPKAMTLPPRDAHPKLKIVTPAVEEPQMVRNFPVDKYEIEASPLTLQILQKREMNKCWQVVIANGVHGFELPFGYLKAAPNFTQVHLYVLAYNYPMLLPLLHDLIHKYNMSPPNDLMYKLNAYVRAIPPYYCPFLRKALLNINIPYPLLQFMLPENADNYLSANIANQLKHIKNTAKQDQENLCMKVYKQLKQPKPPYRQVETVKVNSVAQLRRDLVRHPLLRDTFSKLHAEIEPLDNFTIVVPQMTRQSSAKSYRNPFDIPRRDLIEEIGRMRETFLRPSCAPIVAKDSGHCLPIAEMGNYQEYLKNKDNPLREIEPTNVRQHMFGNPYKKDKHMVMVDEADLGEVAPMKASNGAGGGGPGSVGPPGVMGMPMGAKKLDARSRKRKAGPIRKDYVFRRTSTDSRPGSSAASSAGSSVASMSDFDDDSSSDASSISSGMSEDGDPDRLVIPFDFNEEETPENECPINGYVTSFINGISDDSSCDTDALGGPMGAVNAGIAGLNSPSPIMASTNGIVTASSPSPHPYMAAGGGGYAPHGGAMMAAPEMMAAVAGGGPIIMANHPGGGNIPPAVMYAAAAAAAQQHQQLNGAMAAAAAVGYNMLGGPATIPQMMPPTGTAPVSVPTNASAIYHHPHPHPPALHQQHPPHLQLPQPQHPHPQHPQQQQQPPQLPHHNDINDPQEISRILQQCHNGSLSSADSAAMGDIKMESEGALMPPPPPSMAATINVPSTVSSSSITANASPALLTNSTNSSNNCFDNLKRETTTNHNSAVIATVTPAGLMATAYVNHNNTGAAASVHLNHNNQTLARTMILTPSPPPSLPPPPPPLTDEQRENARRHNLEVREQVFRDIRRPGRNYSQLLDHLNLIKGDYDMKSNFIQMCIDESLRFRRRQMVESIQEWWDRNKKIQGSLGHHNQQQHHHHHHHHHNQQPQQQQQQHQQVSIRS